MKQIYKMLISVFAILILTSAVAIFATENAKAASANSGSTAITNIGMGLSAIYGMYDGGTHWLDDTTNYNAIVLNYSFNLPNNSYVMVGTMGQIGLAGRTSIGLSIDSTSLDWSTEKTYLVSCAGTELSCAFPAMAFSISRVYYLNAGKHTVYLFGTTETPSSQWLNGATISVVASQKGSLEIRNVNS